MKKFLLTALCGCLVGSVITLVVTGRKVRVLPSAPDAALHSFEVYCPGNPDIAETLLILPPDGEPQPDRPTWIVRYSTSENVTTYRCQPATLRR